MYPTDEDDFFVVFCARSPVNQETSSKGSRFLTVKKKEIIARI